jgi:mannose-1-phosphate guanylyltransferase / mannose-6-phosphate isomerase
VRRHVGYLFMKKVVPVILSGGAGTRLWPASRTRLPKQFLPLIEGETSFSQTLSRVSDDSLFSPPIVVTGSQFEQLVETELSRHGKAGRVVLEPMRRDSAAAIAVAAVLAAELDPESVLLVLAADHYIRPAEAFVAGVRAGLGAAREGYIVTFGIRPDKPATAYGYIQPAAAIHDEVHEVARFVEKPNEERAQELIEAGCVWNSGNFLFRSDVLLAELEQFAPDILRSTRDAVKLRSTRTLGGLTIDVLDHAAFEATRATSIDFAVMEKTRRSAVLPVSYGWSDLGSWDSIWEALPKDEAGNATSGAVTLAGASNCLLTSDGTHLAAIGVSDLAIVATKDALLVAPRNVTGELKKLVSDLEGDPLTQSLIQHHPRKLRSWGSSEELLTSPAFKVRQLMIRPKQHTEISLDDVTLANYVVLEGTVELLDGHNVQIMGPGDSLGLKGVSRVRLTNSQDFDVCVLETRHARSGS